MDDLLFREDWATLSADLLEVVEECFGQAVCKKFQEISQLVGLDRLPANDIFYALESQSLEQLEMYFKIHGLLLNTFSLTQHVHKTVKFFKKTQSSEKKHILLSCDRHTMKRKLNFWLSVTTITSSTLTLDDVFSQSFSDVFHFRLANDNTLSSDIRKMLKVRLKALLLKEFKMTTLNFHESCERILDLLFQSFYGAWDLIDLEQWKNQCADFSVSVTLEPTWEELNDCLQLMKSLNQKIEKMTNTHRETLQLRRTHLLPSSPAFQNIQRQEELFISHLPHFYLKISSQLIVKFIEVAFQKIYQKRLKKTFEEDPQFLRSLNIQEFILEVKKLRSSSLIANEYFFQMMDLFQPHSRQLFPGLIAGDIRSAYEFSVILWFSSIFFEEDFHIVPAFEHPSAISNVCDLLDQTQVLLRKIHTPFTSQHFHTLFLGYRHHLKEKSYWWTQTQLYHAQNDLFDWSKMRGYVLNIIQARGGSLAKGSMPTRCLMNTSCFDQDRQELSFVISYESIRQRLQTPQIAAMTVLRYFEEFGELIEKKTQLSHKMNISGSATIRSLQKSLADHSLPEVEYYAVEQPDLIDYFYAITPADFLQQDSAQYQRQYRLEDLDVSVWFGCWSQCRLFLPFWLGLSSVLTQWSHDSSIHRELLKDDLFTQSLFIVMNIALHRVDLPILQLYESELLSPHLRELGEYLQSRYQKVLEKMTKFIDLYEKDAYVKNFGDDIRLRSQSLRFIHCLQIECIKRARSDWADGRRYYDLIRQSAFLIGSGLQNSI